MNKSQFFDYVGNPDLLNENTITPLNEIIDEYPWFQTARVLRIKNLHILDHLKFNSELKTSAAFIADRKRLFELVHQKAQKDNCIKADEKALPAQKGETNKPEQTIEKPKSSKKDQKSSVGLSTQLSSISDYFQTDDVYENSDGTSIDFAKSASELKDDNTNSIVLPSADFLEYETSDYSGYQLNESIQPDDETNRSFSGWLNVLRHAPAPQSSKETKPVKKKSQQLIDSFLSVEKPRIKTSQDDKSTVKNEDRHQRSVDENDDLLSETLANIYIKQNHYEKAISIYEKLRLKYPEKNVYFAERISDLEKLINNK